jgi:hypothetical protein
MSAPFACECEGTLLWMILIWLHRLSTPPDKRQIPDFQSPLEHRDGKESSIIVIVRFLVWSRESRVLGVIQSEDVSFIRKRCEMETCLRAISAKSSSV